MDEGGAPLDHREVVVVVVVVVISPALQQDLGDQILQARVERVGEEAKDLLRRAEVVKKDVTGQDVEGLDQLDGENTHIHTHVTIYFSYMALHSCNEERHINTGCFLKVRNLYSNTKVRCR